MPRKPAKKSVSKPVKRVSTPVRRSPIPKPAAVKPATVKPSIRPSAVKPGLSQASRVALPVSWEQVQLRAYFIYCSGQPGSQDDHWFQAERELRSAT